MQRDISARPAPWAPSPVARRMANLPLICCLSLLAGCGTGAGRVAFGPAAPAIPEPKMIAERASNTIGQVTTMGAREYVAVGYYETYQACSAYFDNLIATQNQTRFTGDVVTAGGAAATALIALRKNTEAAARIVAKWAAGTAFLSSVISSFDDRALMTPYPSETKTLIMGALAKYEADAPPSSVVHDEDALGLVAGYAEMCTYSGITRFAKQALSNAIPENAGAPGARLGKEDVIDIDAASSVLGMGSDRLSPRQVALLHFYITEPTAFGKAAQAKALLKELPASVAANLGLGKEALVDPNSIPGVKAAAPALKRIVERNADLKGIVAETAKGFGGDPSLTMGVETGEGRATGSNIGRTPRPSIRF